MMHPNRLQIGLVAAVALLAVALGTSASAEEAQVEAGVGPMADLQAIQNAFEALAKKVAPAVVTIKSVRPEQRSSAASPVTGNVSTRGRRVYGAGSGVIIRADGMILTNEHVVHHALEIIVHLNDGREFTGELLQCDRRSDLAIVRIDTQDLPAAVLGDVAGLRQGHMVFAMGNPFGIASDAGGASMSWGVVKALGRPLPLLGAAEDRYYGNLIETDAAINPGNSGGPLFDIYGHVVGITTAISTRTGQSEGVGFAVPISHRTREIIEALLKGQEVEYGLLGVFLRTPDHKERARTGGPPNLGALVEAVDTGSPAHQVRIRPGDLIVRFDGRDVTDDDHLVRMVGSTPPGRVVEIVYYRDGKRQTVRATLSCRDRTARRSTAPVRWRGLTLQPIEPKTGRSPKADDASDGRRSSLIVVRVRPGSQAERAGFRPGMVLDRIDDKTVTAAQPFQHLVRRLEGQSVEVTVYGGRRLRLQPH